jgi:4-amino-4-deoxy-L-arabinose transferase-like glycosyltransferase
MKNRPASFSKRKANRSGTGLTVSVPDRPGKAPSPSVEVWLAEHRRQVIAVLVLLWLAIRVMMLQTVSSGPLFHMYKWPASDNHFFDEWARTLAAGDWLNRQPLHPYHRWHDEFATYYLNRHPEKKASIEFGTANQAIAPGEVLWKEWYGGNIYHQEPLYAYILALFYALTGNGVFPMMLAQGLLGVLSGVLIWVLTRKYFGDLTALVAGLLYLFCGIILFQEALILRTAWSVFFALLTVWTLEKALESRKGPAYLVCGMCLGLAYLLQAVFSIYMLGALCLGFIRERTHPGLFARHAALLLLGFVAVNVPVIMRNAVVGAPLLSISSVGAVTFVSGNVYGTKTISNWAPDAGKCAEIMGKTEGNFGAVIVETVGTHPSAASYGKLLWSKLQRVLDGLEWPNNENYYFYRQLAPALRWTFLDFYWIGWAGVAGIIFSLYYRRKTQAIYLAMLIQVAIMLGFYVLGRFRTPLVALMIPFAAYALVECTRWSRTGRMEAVGKWAIAALCCYFLSYSYRQHAVSMLDPTDFNVMYELAYYDRIKNNADAGHWREAIACHEAFLDTQPEFVKNAKAGQMLRDAQQINVLDFFAEHYKMQSYLYADSGNPSMAAKYMVKHDALKQIAQNSRKRLTQ